MFGGPPSPFGVCASKPWSICSVCKNLRGQHPFYHDCHRARRTEKFRESTPTISKVIGDHTLNFKPKFACSPLKFFGYPHPCLRCALAISVGQYVARVKIWGASGPALHSLRAEKVDLRGSKLTCPTFWTVDQSSPNFFRRTRKASVSITCLSRFQFWISWLAKDNVKK